MTRKEKPEAKPEAVKVRLLCIYSGDGHSEGYGAEIELPADEAARLIGMGAAEAVK